MQSTVHSQRPVDSITLAHVGKFFNSPAIKTLPNGRPRAEITVKQIRRVFRQCMEFALEKGWLAVTPIPKSELQHARAKAPKRETPRPVKATVQS
jgi:beta-galactosidase/beta-glucuronidase